MSGGAPSAPSVQDNSLQVEMAREAAAERAQQAADAKTAQDKVDFQTRLGTAVSGAKVTGDNYLASRGLSPNDFSSVEDSIINNAKLRVPDLDSNPGQYFTDDTFASGLDNYQNTQRANFNSKVNTTFAPGFENNLIGDNAGSGIVDSILGDQQKTAQQQLDFNKARGVLNDSGYNAAEGVLNQQGASGRSTLNDIASSVIGKYRGDLTAIKGNAGDAASNYNLGEATPDIGSFYNRATTKATDDLSGIEGSIRSALGGTNLFDVASAIAKGGTAQGPINITTADSAPGVPFATKKSNTNRGLGSTGQF